jgi:hypothetical protein
MSPNFLQTAMDSVIRPGSQPLVLRPSSFHPWHLGSSIPPKGVLGRPRSASSGQTLPERRGCR